MGSLAEETAKLIGVLSGWACENVAEASERFQEPASEATESAHRFSDHEGLRATECTTCPVCRTIHAVRQLSPDVKEHLAAAATSLAHAATALLATVLPDDREATDDGAASADLEDERPAGR